MHGFRPAGFLGLSSAAAAGEASYPQSNKRNAATFPLLPPTSPPAMYEDAWISAVVPEHYAQPERPKPGHRRRVSLLKQPNVSPQSTSRRCVLVCPWY